MDKNGGPAFPAHDYIVGDLSRDQFQKLGESRGMSLRDYFAGQVLSGYAAAGKSVNDSKNLSECAYEWADAMLKAREGK